MEIFYCVKCGQRIRQCELVFLESSYDNLKPYHEGCLQWSNEIKEEKTTK